MFDESLLEHEKKLQLRTDTCECVGLSFVELWTCAFLFWMYQWQIGVPVMFC